MASPSESTTQRLDLAGFNALADADALPMLLGVCSSPAWAAGVLAGRPYRSVDDLLDAADRVLSRIAEEEVDAALAGHPRIGDTLPAGSRWSAREQSGVAGADDGVRQALDEGNRAYEERFGQVYLVCATGRSAQEMLDFLHQRLSNDPVTERAVLREELRKINRIRLEQVVAR